MNELKIKVVGYSDNGISEIYLYYFNKKNNIVATIAVNNQGDLIGEILDYNCSKKIVSDINELTGFNLDIEENYYINNNKVVWDNTIKFIKDNNLEIKYKTELDFEIEESSKRK